MRAYNVDEIYPSLKKDGKMTSILVNIRLFTSTCFVEQKRSQGSKKSLLMFSATDFNEIW